MVNSKLLNKPPQNNNHLDRSQMFYKTNRVLCGKHLQFYRICSTDLLQPASSLNIGACPIGDFEYLSQANAVALAKVSLEVAQKVPESGEQKSN